MGGSISCFHPFLFFKGDRRMLALMLMVFGRNSQDVVLDFIKADTVNSENVVYTAKCLQNIIKTIDTKPIYLVQYNKDKESGLIKVGEVTCCFLNKNWIAARAELLKPLSANYVLRAHVRATNAKYKPDGVYVVDECEVIKFYLKPKEKAVRYDIVK